MNYRDTLMWKELNEAPAILQTLAQKNAKALAGIAAAAKEAAIAGVYTAARGTSDHAMIYFKYLCEAQCGLPVASGAPSVVTMYGGGLALGKFLTVGCSQSGKAADVLAVIERAKACGAPTVAITNDEESPLAKAADFHLYCNAGEEKSVAATKTFSAQIALARLLAGALSGTPADAAADLAVQCVPVADAVTDEAAKAFAGAEDCFTLGRGITAAIAFECGLKLQETCYIKARAYHSSDFYHGPMAMIGKGTKVILFASGKALGGNAAPLREDSVKCANKMLELGADLYIVTDDAALFAGLPAKVLAVPGGKTEAETAQSLALAAQMLACKTSCLRGLNPDSPRALKKVTVTV